MIRGECTDCGKTYKVPSADRTYTCKACSGEVRVPEPEEPKAAIPCAECGEWNDAEDAFCVECGASLGKTAASKSDAKPKRSHLERQERLHASKELKEAKRAVFIARSIFGIWAAFILIMGLLALISPAAVFQGYPPGDAQGMAFILAGICILVAGGLALLIWFLPRAPLVLGLSAASVFTVLALVGFVLSDSGEAPKARQILPIVALWVGTFQLSKVRRLKRDYPDLFGARAWGGGDGRLHADGIGASRQKVDRGRSRMRSKDRKLRLAIIGSIVFVLGGGGFFYWFSKQPSALEPRLEQFREAWGSSRAAIIQPYFATLQQDDIEKWFRYRQRKDGWGEEWPAFAGFEVGERRGNQALADFIFQPEMVGPGAHLQTRWEWRDDAWYLDKIKLVREER